MKKTLPIILALVMVLSLYGSAFAANDNLTMSYSTSVVNGLRVNNFEFRDTEGRLIREETDTLGSQGQLIQKNITFFNEAGQKISQRMAGLEDNGAWRDDEAVWTYNSDGSLVVNNRVVFTNPDGTQEFRVIQIKEEADGTSTGRGEKKKKNGNKIFDIEMEYRVDETERVDVVKYTYPDGRVSTERTRNQNDGTEIRRTVDENAAGQEVKSTFFQLNPDGSYNRSSSSTTYRDNGKRFVSQTNEYMDANGNRRKESISYNIDENGVGSGKGVYTEGSRRAIMLIDFRNDEEEGEVCTTTYKFDDGTIDLRNEITTPAGVRTTTYERDVKNYGDSDSETEDPDEQPDEEAENPFDVWDTIFNDWYEGEFSYIGDPTALDSDTENDYYETEVNWGDESDWGDASDWSYDEGDYGNYEDFGGLDDDEGWDDAGGLD